MSLGAGPVGHSWPCRGAEQCRDLCGALPALELMGHLQQSDRDGAVHYSERTRSQSTIHWFHRIVRSVLLISLYHAIHLWSSAFGETGKHSRKQVTPTPDEINLSGNQP